MINLIPKEEKNRSTKIFYYRILMLILYMLGLAIFVGALALLPAFLLSRAKNIAVNQKLELQQSKPLPTPSLETSAIIKDVNRKLVIVENSNKNSFIVSEKIINAVIANKTSDIKIVDISYEKSKEKGKKINIEGVAPSREALLSFRQALEADKLFKQVDLPISNFVKGEDIEFSLSLIPS